MISALITAFQWTLRNSLQVMPLIILAFLISRLMRKRLGARLHYMLGLVVLVGLLLPAVPSSRLSIWNFFSVPSLPGPTKPVQNPSLKVPDQGSNRASFQMERVKFEPEKLSMFMRMAAIAWLTVFVNLVAVAVWRYRSWQRLVNRGRPIEERHALDELERAKLSMGVKRNMALTAVNGLPGPAVFGIFRMHILLPEGLRQQLTAAELRLVLLHELAHVKRNDLLLSWVTMGVQFLHWFNPFAWLALQKLRSDRELVCDAMVMASTGPGEQQSYGKVLLKLAETLWPAPETFSTAASVVGNTSELERRIILIKSYRKSGSTARVMRVAFVILLAGFTLTGARQSERARDTAVPEPASMVLSIDARGDLHLAGWENALTIEELREVLRSNAVRIPNWSCT